MTQVPTRTRAYHNHHLDSTVWDALEPRPDDIIVTTAYKAGTTWMQQILAMLLFQGQDPPQPLAEISPWVDLRVPPTSDKVAALAEQKHRRFLKSHLPLDGLRWVPECKYVYVGRDGRDVFMSMLNHYQNANQEWYDILNESPGRVGEPMPPYPGDPHQMWADWISRGWFAWERDGYPFWSLFHHVQSWWSYHHLPNVLFVHFADLRRDLAAEIQRIATFLDIEISPDRFDTVVQKCTFSYMKQNADQVAPRQGGFWKGGATTFINKGTNGRWRELLTDGEIAQYRAAVAERLEPDCAHWLEHGAGG